MNSMSTLGGMESRGLLRGKAALITGGEGSIGMATARAYVAEGARVCLVGLLADSLQAGAASLGGEATWAVEEAVLRNPQAATALVQVIRLGSTLSSAASLVV